MKINHIRVSNFKNIAEADLDFSPKVNCFLGNNGMGKSNLLDSIYYMSFCKSFSGMTDTMLIKRDEEFSMIDATYSRRGVEEHLQFGITRGHRKSLKRGGKPYQRLSQHIGAFPLVLSSPHDIDLIRGTGEERRRWLDMIISQADAVYLDELIRYNRCLEQRNKLLRDHVADPSLYIALEIQMDRAAEYITSCRERYVGEIAGIFNRYYADIAGEGESVTLAYHRGTDVPEMPLLELLERNRHRDEIIGHTTVGPHRDDIEMLIDGMPMRRVASQGQCKTYVITLRLAQYEFLRGISGMMPLLLLDDIFDKLDASRVEKIMEIVTHDDFGQIFVTDTNRLHLDEIMRRTRGDYRMWFVDSGRLTPIE